ncbi:MAG: glycosyltransferase family 2 protein, partial [Planctomycetota bacterium]
ALLDCDDWYAPHHLERTTAFLQSHPECGVLGTNYYLINARGERILGCKPNQILGRPGDGVIPDYFRASMRNRCFPVVCGTVLRRDLVRSLGGFDGSLDGAEDKELYVRWAMVTRYGYVDEPLACYRDYTPGSVRKNLPNTIRKRLELWQKLVAAEPVPAWCRRSYKVHRSFCLFRLTALSIATGHFDVTRGAVATWPHSPTHLWWWLGRALGFLPAFGQRGLHLALRRFSFVRYRTGETATVEARAE